MSRPRRFETPELFDAAVDGYVEQCKAEESPITWTGMAMALGFTSRRAVDNYLEYEGFEESVRRAKLIVENAYEQRLHGNNPTGAIFALKNMQWSDRHEISGPDSQPLGPLAIRFVDGIGGEPSKQVDGDGA